MPTTTKMSYTLTTEFHCFKHLMWRTCTSLPSVEKDVIFEASVRSEWFLLCFVWRELLKIFVKDFSIDSIMHFQKVLLNTVLLIDIGKRRICECNWYLFFNVGPRLFLSCPMDLDQAEIWFTDLWNYSVVPYMLEAVRDGIQVGNWILQKLSSIENFSWIAFSFNRTVKNSFRCTITLHTCKFFVDVLWSRHS